MLVILMIIIFGEVVISVIYMHGPDVRFSQIKYFDEAYTFMRCTHLRGAYFGEVHTLGRWQ